MFFRRWGAGHKPGKREDNVRFLINGKEYKISSTDKYTPESKLVDFIRDEAGLKGTKYMCREGGCGVCIVTVRKTDPKTGDSIAKAVNSCLIPLFRCNGWDISTIESLGNKKDGYHPVQQRLVKFGGTQCGFCTPGMTMSMYSLLETKSDINTRDVENNLDGNICRCTGYRPILDAFCSFAIDASAEIQQTQDIEDCLAYPCPIINATRAIEPSPGFPSTSTDFQMVTPTGQVWIKVTTLNEALSKLHSFKSSGKTYRIVAGNTGSGVLPIAPANIYLDISNVAELTKYSLGAEGISIGSCLTLVSIIEVFEKISDMDGYNYMKKMGLHLQRVANNAVRNIGTIGGNLMLKHTNRNFASDIFVLLEGIGAKIIISAQYAQLRPLTPTEFLNIDMSGRVIISVHLPKRSEEYHFNSFKISRRYQNSHAYANAAILMKIAPDRNFKVIEKPRIVYGGISPDFVHATGTEIFLFDKELGDVNTLKGVFEALDLEVRPNEDPALTSLHYRRTLTKSLLYKAILEIVGDLVRDAVKSGSKNLVPKLVRGMQSFEKDVDKSALYKAIPKLDSPLQTSGEAEFVNDMPALPNELFGAFVLTSVARAELDSVDITEAMAIDGVVRFIQAKDIPGTNDYMVSGILPIVRDDPIFVSKKVEAAGQAVGLILADTKEAAFLGASKVKVSYKNQQKPVVNILDAIRKVEMEGRLEEQTKAIFSSKKTSDKDPVHSFKGEFQIGAQYAYHLETQCCICVPKEDSIDIYSSTHWMNHVQWNVASALGVPNNYVNVHVKRLGGSFGAKLTRATHVAAACAVAAFVTNRPVRIVLDMQTNMIMIGKRSPYWSRYEVKVDEIGKILELKINLIPDTGFSENEADSVFGTLFIQNVYAAEGWEVRPGFVNTNTPANTYIRGPGSLAAIAIIEHIMEHIAFVVKRDALEVRTANLRKPGDPSLITGEPFKGENFIPKMLDEIRISADYEQRKQAVDKYNKENRWKKRGLAASTSTFQPHFAGAMFPVYITIYHVDGSVAVTHGGIEMGQGLNTKVAQTVAHVLDVSIDKIKIKASNNLTGSNASFTGGSFSSELCCFAAMRASEVLVERMKPVKEKLSENVSWEKLVAECFAAQIDLSAIYTYKDSDNVKGYMTWAVVITEVEVDILTGEYKVVRVDILEDVGKSLSPLIDIGQIEGGYLLAQGLWTTEKIIHDEETGILLTNRSWNYKPPESKDVPEDFRITLLHNAPNPFGVLRSKAVAEPISCASVSVLFALKNAIASARYDAGNNEWFQLDGPVTQEDVIKHSMTSSTDFLL